MCLEKGIALWYNYNVLISRSKNMKKALFFENAKLLNKSLGIIPLMYGSVGLGYITGESLNSDDIDILIPEAFLKERWNEFKSILAEKGYALADEHAFEKKGVCYAYASIEELEGFAGVKLTEIATESENGATFKKLSLEQYLKVYTASAKDGYRVNVRQKKDNEKLAFIKDRLKKRGNV